MKRDWGPEPTRRDWGPEPIERDWGDEPEPSSQSGSLFDFGGAKPSWGGLGSAVKKYAGTTGLSALKATHPIGNLYNLAVHREIPKIEATNFSNRDKASLLGLGAPIALSAATIPLSASLMLGGTAASLAGGLALSGTVGASSRGAYAAASGEDLGGITKAALDPIGLGIDAAFGTMGHYGRLSKSAWDRLPKGGQEMLRKRVADPTGNAWSATMRAGNRGFDKIAELATRGKLVSVPEGRAVTEGAELGFGDVIPASMKGGKETILEGEGLLEMRDLGRKINELKEKMLARGAARETSEDLIEELAILETQRKALRTSVLPGVAKYGDELSALEEGASGWGVIKEAARPLLFWTAERRLLRSNDPIRRAIGMQVALGRAVNDAVRARGRKKALGILNRFDESDLTPRLSVDDLIDNKVTREMKAAGLTEKDLRPRAYRALKGEEDVVLAGEGTEAVNEYRTFMDAMFELKEEVGVRTSLDVDSINNIVNRGKTVYQLDVEESKELANLLHAAKNPGSMDDAARIRFEELVKKADGHVVWKELDATTKIPHSMSVPIQKQELYVPAYAKGDRKLHGHEVAVEHMRRDPGMSLARAERLAAEQGQKTTTAHLRKTADDSYLEDSIDRLMAKMIESDAELIANTAAWGGKGAVAELDAQREIGMIARKAMDYLMESDPGGKIKGEGASEVKMLRDYLTQRYTRDLSPDTSLMRKAALLTSRTALTRSFATSWGEMGKGLWASGGISGWVRGREIIRRNPELRSFFEDTGAQTAQITDLIQRVVAEGSESLRGAGQILMPLDMMARTERWLRGPVSHGAVSTIHRVAKRAGTAIKPGGTSNGALLHEAREIFPHLTGQEAVEYLGKAYNSTGGTLPKEVWSDGIYNLTRRWFYSTAAGSIPSAFAKPAGLVALQYRPFMLRASQHFGDDILKPLLSGDRSLSMLGAKRLVQMLVYSAPPNVAATLMKATMRGRAPHPASFATQYLGSNFGLAGDAMNVALAKVTGNPGSMEDLTQIPALSIAQAAGQKFTRLTPPDIIEGIGDIGAMRYDPRLGNLDFIAGLIRSVER